MFKPIRVATLYFQQCGMCDLQRLRSACAYAQSDQSLCKLLEYSINIKLLIEYYFEFLSLKEAVHAHLGLFMSKYHIVGNLMSQLKYSTTCLKLPLKNRQYKDLYDKW